MRKLKENIEERIKELLLKGKEKDEERAVSVEVYDDEIIIQSQKVYRTTKDDFGFPRETIKFRDFGKKLTYVWNETYSYKELMEIINIIHNNLCNEENWEEVE